MNNLLRTLTESQVKPAADLRLLLSTVKDGRRQSYDAKLSDPFYDSLEGLLLDLKVITIDNRDAEAFLKPVSKAEVPDYYDVIANPMDFQTMLKKVKQKQYKSKREFKDDLELIWSNCYTYNATENHPLRLCVKRLKAKADRLLKYITDRKDRTDPSIPSELPINNAIARPKINGTNGHINGRTSTRSPSFPLAKSVPSSSSNVIKPSTPLPMKKLHRRDTSFPDSPALIRTAEGMATFQDLDQHLESPAGPSQEAVDRLREMAPPVEYESDHDTEHSHSPDDTAMVIDGALGDKRKLNGVTSNRPRKRARFTSQYLTPLSSDKDELSELWWGAVQSDDLLANGLPSNPFPSSSSPTKPPRPRKAKRRKKALESALPPNPKALLSMMNNNIKTMKRVRHTHAKFAALNANNATNEDAEGEGGAGFAGPSGTGMGGGMGSGMGMGAGAGFGAVEEDEMDDKVDERPWSVDMKGKGKTRAAGIEIGEKNASDCLRWANMKILEHAGFQGTANSSLEVMESLTSEYLLNVGRTIRFLSDKYAKTMTPEEIILHTLFEGGVSKVQDLERYISDDVERYGTRLTELEKKLVGAYRESTAGEVLDDEGLFEEEDEEETGALAMGDFADALGEDYLGLREMGIAAEFGLSSLSIPKKLLKGRKGQNKPAAAKPTEPPPPYPPPPPFIPLTSVKVDDQIGLLKPYYHTRLASMASTAAAAPMNMPMLSGPPGYPPLSNPPRPSLPGPSLPGPSLPGPSLPGPSLPGPPSHGMPNGYSYPPAPPPVQSPPPIITLPDDPPNPVQVKMGPIGQIMKGAPSGATSKKKAKVGMDAPLASAGLLQPPGSSGGTTDGTSPKKKKGATGVGTGNGRKKKLADAQPFSQSNGHGYGQGPGHSNGHGPQGSPLPPVVAASA